MPTVLVFLNILLLAPQGQSSSVSAKAGLAQVVGTAVPSMLSDRIPMLARQWAASELDESEVQVGTVSRVTGMPHGSLPRGAHRRVTCAIQVVTKSDMDLAILMPAQGVSDRIVRDSISPCLP